MNKYETVFILTPVLSDAQMKEAVEKLIDLIEGKKVESCLNLPVRLLEGKTT